MNPISLISGATTISTLHALLPDHWLAFILVGSSRGWSGNKIMKIAFLAGCSHVAMTSVLGLVVATIDGGIISQIGLVETHISSGILILLGFIYVLLGISHKNSRDDFFKDELSEKATTTSLILMLTLSPCEAIIPIFFVAGSFGFSILLMLSITVALGTLTSMLAIIYIIYLTLAGYKRLRFTWLEKNEKATIGIVLLILGVFNILFG